MQLPFGSYRRHVPGSSQRLVNIMAEAQPLGAKGPIALMRTPGVRAHKNVGAGPGRGLALHDDKLYAVSGTKLYQVPKLGAAGAVTERGTVPGSGRVRMKSNSLSLGIVTNPDMYTLTGTALAQILDADFTARGAASIDFLDGYFVHIQPGSPNHFSSDLYATTYDALKFGVAEATPDDLVDEVVNERERVLFGKQSIERWYHSGADNYPFEKMSGGDIQIGCLGGVALVDSAERFLASDKTLRVISGQAAQRFSTHAVEEYLRQYTAITGAYGFAYTIEGHVVYVLQVPDQATWCFDITTGEFHERASNGQNDWRVMAALEVDGVVYVQDKATGKVGILDATAYDEWGDTLRAECTYPTVYDNGRLLFHNAFEIVVKAGVGLAAGQGSDPEVGLDYSDDGGRTWLAAENRTIGKIGEYLWRVFWNELGASHQRVYRNWISDPVDFVISDARVAIEPGDL